MERVSLDGRLSSIETMWTLVGQVQDEQAAARLVAQEKLLSRYGKAIHRYLLGAFHDEDLANELGQEFALRFLRGDLKGLDPARGRFRDFVRGVLYHLIVDHHRKQKGGPGPLLAEAAEAAESASTLDSDRAFTTSWRHELLERAWAALKSLEDETGQPFHTVLQYRAAHPEANSEQLAAALGERLSKPITAPAVRQTLHRAREKFAEFLVEDVLHSLHNPTVDTLAEELMDIGLYEYCQSYVEKLRG